MKEKWIPVETALPKMNKLGLSEVVIVTVESEYGATTRHAYRRDGKWVISGSKLPYGEVTAWIPIPKPYKKEKNNEQSL